MDDDLEFCLGQFFDDQNKIIHGHLETIKGQEELEAETIKYHQHELLRRWERLCDEVQKLIQQLIRELRDNEQAIRYNNYAISDITH
jgi:predicted component of type VI protein secretion system